MPDITTADASPLRVGSLFSGYGGLDLAVERAFHARTVWFCEVNEPVARVYARRWPGVPNLGDITAVNWEAVEPVDILCGGFPCQDVSTFGKRAGLGPGTRSGLWAYMAAAIDALQPVWVVIENVRGLLSALTRRATTEQGANHEQREPGHTTSAVRDLESDLWGLGDRPAQPLRALGAVLGDLADLRYDARWLGLPASLIGAPHPRFRIFILARRAVSDAAGDRCVPWFGNGGTRQGTQRRGRAQSPDHGPRKPTEPASGAGVRVDRGLLRRWGQYAEAIARWEHITGRPAPAPAILTEQGTPRLSPTFVEWLMGLEPGWVTDPALRLTHRQQLTALGNGVLPRQAEVAIRILSTLA